MGRDPAARGSARGGDPIPALRPARARLILAASAVAGAIGLALYAALTADRAGLALGLLGFAGAVLLAVALSLRHVPLVAPALVLLGSEYAVYFALRNDVVDVRAPLYAAGFLAVAELAFAALELRAGTPEEGLVPRRIAMLALFALGAVVAGTLVLAVATVPIGGGIVLEAIGMVAAIALVFGLGALAVRMR